MSDRTPSSVRTGSRPGTPRAPTDSAPAEPGHAGIRHADPVDPRAPGRSAAQARRSTGGAPPPAHRASRSRLRRSRPPPAALPPVPPAVGRGARAPAPLPGAVPTGAPAADPAAAPPAAGGRAAKSRGPRRARLQLRHIDTWSALKISLVLSIALFFIWMVAVGVLYGVLSALGVFDTLNDLFGQLGIASGSGSGGGGDVITPGVVFGGAAVIGAINIVLHDGAVHRRHVHLQPVLRPGRRPRAHALRARLSDIAILRIAPRPAILRSHGVGAVPGGASRFRPARTLRAPLGVTFRPPC